MWHWLLHVTGGDNGSGSWYLEWSGFISLIITILPMWIGIWVFIRKHNCHVDGCWRLRTHVDEGGMVACKHHHTQRHKIGKNPHE